MQEVSCGWSDRESAPVKSEQEDFQRRFQTRTSTPCPLELPFWKRGVNLVC